MEAPLPAPSSPRAGQRIGPFELTELVGQRDDISLYRAVRPGGNRQPSVVAVRIADNPRDDVAGAWVRHEYDVLRIMDDPRIPKAFGYYAGQIAVATSWIDGVRLDQILDARASGKLVIDAPTALDLLTEVAEALRHVHTRSDEQGAMFHGWLNPSTIWLRPDGKVMISGLGALPRPVPAGYVPPEEAAGAFVDARSDQWRIGALGIELLLGGPLYQGAADPPAAAAVGDAEPWISRVEKRWPPAARVLRTALSPAAGTRFAGDGELIKELLEVGRNLGRPDRHALVSRARALMTAAAADAAEARTTAGDADAPSMASERPTGIGAAAPAGRPRPTPGGAPVPGRRPAAGRTAVTAALSRAAADARDALDDGPDDSPALRRLPQNAPRTAPAGAAGGGTASDTAPSTPPRPVAPASPTVARLTPPIAAAAPLEPVVARAAVPAAVSVVEVDDAPSAPSASAAAAPAPRAASLPPIPQARASTSGHSGPVLAAPPPRIEADEPSLGLRAAGPPAEPSFSGIPSPAMPRVRMPEPSIGDPLTHSSARPAVVIGRRDRLADPVSVSAAPRPVPAAAPAEQPEAEVTEAPETPDAENRPESAATRKRPPFEPIEYVAAALLGVFVVIAITFVIHRFGG